MTEGQALSENYDDYDFTKNIKEIIECTLKKESGVKLKRLGLLKF